MARYANQRTANGCGVFSAAAGGVAVGAILACVVIALLAVAVFFLRNAWMEENLARIMTVASFGVVVLGAVYSGWRLRMRGLAVGTLTGLFYAAIALGVAACVSAGDAPTLLWVNKFVLHVLAGALGGVIGVNLSA